MCVCVLTAVPCLQQGPWFTNNLSVNLIAPQTKLYVQLISTEDSSKIAFHVIFCGFPPRDVISPRRQGRKCFFKKKLGWESNGQHASHTHTHTKKGNIWAHEKCKAVRGRQCLFCLYPICFPVEAQKPEQVKCHMGEGSASIALWKASCPVDEKSRLRQPSLVESEVHYTSFVYWILKYWLFVDSPKYM